ncbi:hypothetical protein M514_06570 [Trichuris suis]|uniref:Histone deacetylase n=1 Tax=Trichuris suis TaxID=68888 RepID=A0A085M5P0_9BILA|nr:hypothetical protein M513_06570 [Trichuris suis]KFD59458.1 hypothetical protein M514_06570 [Trichuris suis]KHJ40683.1 histone deacetylase family protein [Trichuris suis]
MPRISYLYNEGMEAFHYGDMHPMKPRRIVMTHALLYDYDLLRAMDCYTSADASVAQMCSFHSAEYIHFLERTSTWDQNELKKEYQRFNIDGDCPIFDGVFKFCAKYAGASLAAASLLNEDKYDIAINWSGGLHHAKKSMASGFCYVNDIVIATLEMLRRRSRILYIDIDVHHGDGVQEAFYLTDRVMTLSFHMFGDNFFPGTGLPSEKGDGIGLGYALNVPLQSGIDDEMYHSIFKPVVAETVRCYQPECIVLQCGADSLGEDRLGYFNLTIKGHGECVRFVKSLGLPMLVVGGGGYTARNVARCWAYETAVLLERELPDRIPEQNIFFSSYGPSFALCPPLTNVYRNCNSVAYIDCCRRYIFERLRNLPGAPNVGLANQSIMLAPSTFRCEN